MELEAAKKSLYEERMKWKKEKAGLVKLMDDARV